MLCAGIQGSTVEVTHVVRTDFFVASIPTLEGERFVVLLPSEIPASFFFANSWEEKLRELTLLTEEGFRRRLAKLGLSPDDVNYQLERARGEHLSVR
jgi:hypothetical protein